MLWSQSSQWAKSWISGTASAQGGPAENQVHAVATPSGNTAEAGAVPHGSLMPSSISGGGSAAAAMPTIPVPHAGHPQVPLLPGCPLPRQGKSDCSPGSAAPGEILAGDSSRLQPWQPSLTPRPGNTWEMPQPRPWQAGEPWEEPGRASPSPCPVSQPCLAASTCPPPMGARAWCCPPGVPSPVGGTGRLGAAYLLSRGRAPSVRAQAHGHRACRSNTTV